MQPRRETFFSYAPSMLCCPTCHAALFRDENSLRCENGHCLNVHRKGYLNVLNRPVQGIYDKTLFDARKQVLESGLYNAVLSGILSMIPEDVSTILDCGCGEGWWLQSILSRLPQARGIGLDLSADAIATASQREIHGCLLVADLKHMPVPDQSVDVLLNILTPADYRAFTRVLKPDGILIKVWPGKEYLAEMRILRGLPMHDDREVAEYLEKRTKVMACAEVRHTYPVSDALWQALVCMTPMNETLSETEKMQLAQTNPHTITMDLRVAACTMPQHLEG